VSFTGRRILEIVARVCAVFVLHVLLFGALLWAGVASGELHTPSESWHSSRALVFVAVLNSCMFSYLVLRARERSTRMAWLLGLAFFGGHTVLGSIDSVAFPHVSRASELPIPPVVLNAVFTVLFVPLALAVLNVDVDSESEPAERSREPPSASAWLWRLVLGLVVHQAVFVAAGFWIAQASLRPQGSAAIAVELQHVLHDTPWLPGLQVVRGLLWITLSLPLIRMLRGPRWETSFALGTFWAVVSSGELGFLASHSLDFVSRRHLLLFAAANFVAGALLGALLRLDREADRERRGARKVLLYRW
jgi:hypothetical protein